MRELELLLGSSAQGAAGTLAVFFAGLAIGSAIWSRRAPRSQRPLAEYGLLEIGIGLSGILYFSLMFLYAQVYSPVHEAFGDTPGLLLTVKMILACGVLLPPAILMGGTLPLMSQHIVTTRNTLGRTGALLYGINTLGAASGALAAGLFLPRWLGFNNTYLIAVVGSIAIGAIAWVLGRRSNLSLKPSSFDEIEAPTTVSSEKEWRDSDLLSKPQLIVAAFGSGALAIAMEVLWTRMFQQVLQNSVYTFSIILVTFLLALATGAFVARKIASAKVNPWLALSLLLSVAAVGTLASPFIFFSVTDGMRYLGAGQAWSDYWVSVLSAGFMVLFIPGVMVGSVFPYLLRVAEHSGEPGTVVGRLSALNTTGSIVGSLVTGFVLLSTAGLWVSILMVTMAYLLLSVWISLVSARRWVAIPILGVGLGLTVANPSALPGVRLNPDLETVLGSWEGPDGYVAVIERKGSRRIKINNFYALGSTGAVQHEQNQTLIPLMSHTSPSNLFYLGMGTGITAGAALRLPSEQVTVAELVPEVVTAAAAFFDEPALGLFSNPRTRILARDGRNELRGVNESFDAILADLFIPWRAGVGNLYSRDHYLTARSRLRPGGMYVQWIPLYQVTDSEMWTITRTIQDVNPQVHLCRGDCNEQKHILTNDLSLDEDTQAN
ncbi:MAG: fused MFS/spermidine synthase, partial [Pseudomonadota bacterium]